MLHIPSKSTPSAMRSRAAVSVTGLAGPEGDGSGQPVGTVWIGTALAGEAPGAAVFRFSGSRNEIRAAAAREAVACLLARIKGRI
jgi:nicotinamide mononucleotide (NMN) deamidase PncC